MCNLFNRLYWYLFHRVFVASNAQSFIRRKNIKHSSVSVCSQSTFVVDPTARIVDSTIQLHDGSTLLVGNGVVLRGVNIDLRTSQVEIQTNTTLENSKLVAFKHSSIRIEAESHGKQIDLQANHSIVDIEAHVKLSDWTLGINNESQLHIGREVICERGDNWRGPVWEIENHSNVVIGNYNRLRNNLWTRFGAQVEVGIYNCINEGTEIRADESVLIGNYNMISYLCRIWDTDTHSFYVDNTRRKMTQEMFPRIGSEVDKPLTKPIIIGNDCLIGEGAIILKGSKIGDKVKIGTRAIVSNVNVEDNHTVVCEKCRIL